MMRVNETETKRLLEAVKPAKLVAATKYIDEKEVEKLEECGVISRRDGSKPRQVLLSKDELENMK